MSFKSDNIFARMERKDVLVILVKTGAPMPPLAKPTGVVYNNDSGTILVTGSDINACLKHQVNHDLFRPGYGFGCEYYFASGVDG